MAVDGSLKFDTKLDDSGLSSGMERIGSIAAKGVAAVGAAVGAMSGYAVKVGADFEEGMSKVGAISGATAEDMQILTDKAKEMGIKTKFSATESAEAMQYMAMAGWKTADMVGSIDGIMNLAAASGENLASVSDIVTDAMTAFGLAADETANIVGKDGLIHEVSNAAFFADVLAAASSNSNTNVAMMGETFKYVAPLAGSLGYSIEDTALAIGMMANAGIKGSNAGTALRSILTRLAKPTNESEQAMSDLGISITNTDGSMKAFYDVMADMRKGFKGLTEDQKASYAAMLGGQEAMSGLLAIVNASDTDFNKLTQAIDESNGAAEEMASIMNDNLKGKITLLGSSLEGLGIQAYEKFEQPLKGAAEAGIKSIEKLSRSLASGKLSKSMDKVANGFADLIAAVIDLAADAIPVLINSFAFVIDNSEKVIAVLATLGAAMAMKKYIVPAVSAFKTAMAAVDAYNVRLLAASASGLKFNGTLSLGQAVVGLFTGKVTLATAATTAWNAACSALGGPIGVAIVAVGALVAGIGALMLSMDSESKRHKENMEAIQEEIDAREELRSTQIEQQAANLGEITNVQSLSAELQNLADANGKVKEGYEARANFIVGALNDALGLNMQLVDGEIQGYADVCTSIDNLIAKKRAEIIVESQLSAYKKAVTDATNAQIKADELQTEISKNNAKAKALESELIKKYGEDYMSNTQAIRDSRYRELSDLKTETIDKQAEYEKQNELVQGYYTDMATYETNATLLASGNAEAYNQIQASTLAKKAETVQGKIKELEKEKTAEQAHLEFLRGELANATTAEQQRALQAQIDAKEAAIKAKQEEMDGLKATVINKGPEYDAEVKKLALKALSSFAGDTEQYFGVSQKKFDKVIKGLKSKDPEVKKKALETAKDMLKSLKSKDDEFSKAGANILDGVIKGSNSKAGDLYSTMANYGNTMLKSFKDSLGIKSPSRRFAEVTSWIPKGSAKGVLDNQGSAIDAINEMADNMVDAYDLSEFTDEAEAQTTRMFDTLDHILQKRSLTYDVSANINDERLERMRSIAVSNGVARQTLGNAINVTQGSSNTVKYEVNQTITSPEPLSPSEISEKTESMILRLGWQL